MKKFYISKNYRSPYTASSKAKIDSEIIVSNLGFQNIGLKMSTYQNKLIGRLKTMISLWIGILRMPRNGIFFVQYPINYIMPQIKMAKRRNNEIILLIHDLNILREQSLSDLTPLKEVDVIIAHTQSMRNWLIDKGINKNIQILEIFDYLDKERDVIETEGLHGYNIAFAGNLGKSKFLEKVTPKVYKLKLFGIGVDNLTLKDNAEFIGCFHPKDLADNLNSDFGLVWDGENIDTCSGITGEYLRYISPHKLSMYLSSGLPVFVWKDSAMAKFVEENKLGFEISNLNEIDEILNALDYNTYQNIIYNVHDMSKKIRTGYFLSKIVSESIK